MKHKFLLPLATLTLLSGCGGSTTADLDELLGGISLGNTILSAGVELKNSAENTALQGITAVKGTAAELVADAASNAPLEVDETNFAAVLDDIQIGEAGSYLSPDDDDGTIIATTIVKVIDELAGEEAFIAINTGPESSTSGAIVINRSWSEFVNNEQEIEALDAYEQASILMTSAEIITIFGLDPTSNIRFEIADEDRFDGTTFLPIEWKTELTVKDINDENAVSVTLTKSDIIDSNDRFRLDADYLTMIETEISPGLFMSPNGTHTYSGIVLLSNDEGTEAVAGDNLEISVDFTNSIGTLRAPDLTGEDSTGSLMGQFTVMNATGSFIGNTVSILNDTNETGRLIGNFNSTAGLLGGIVNGAEISGAIVGQKD